MSDPGKAGHTSRQIERRLASPITPVNNDQMRIQAAQIRKRTADREQVAFVDAAEASFVVDHDIGRRGAGDGDELSHQRWVQRFVVVCDFDLHQESRISVARCIQIRVRQVVQRPNPDSGGEDFNRAVAPVDFDFVRIIQPQIFEAQIQSHRFAFVH